MNENNCPQKDKPDSTEKLRSVVLNYPNCCPYCKNQIIHPSIPVGEDAIVENDVVWFQCMNTACKKQFATRLVKTNEFRHLFLVFAPNMPMSMLLLEGGQSQALKADMIDRMKKSFKEDAMLVIYTIEELMNKKNSGPWKKFIEDTNHLTEAPEISFKPDGQAKRRSGLSTILAEGRKATTDPQPIKGVEFRSMKDLKDDRD